MIDVRIRTRVSEEEVGRKVGKIVGPRDWNLVLTGPARVRKPDGTPLCIYLPGAIPEAVAEASYPVLHSMRTVLTTNRGYAAGSPVLSRPRQDGSDSFTKTMSVRSAVIGAMDRNVRRRFCRLTAWTGDHLAELPALGPMLGVVSEALAEHVPDRYAVQWEMAERTDPAWRFADTPFTTLTVNNTYPTGVHMDDGDLEAGYSAIACLRRGRYAGGLLVFPGFRIAVDLQDRDLLLMDAHEWHGNSRIETETEDAERISVVFYYREWMARCGTGPEEASLAQRDVERRSAKALS